MITHHGREFKSRKNRKRALTKRQYGHEGELKADTLIPVLMRSIAKKFRSTFGVSKHRKARIARFQARQRSRR